MSSVGFDNCGCVDGLLIWTSKPTKSVLEEVKLGTNKYYVVERNVWVKYAGYL